MAQTGGVGLIVEPGCVLPANTPDATVATVVKALGGPHHPTMIPKASSRPVQVGWEPTWIAEESGERTRAAK